MDRKFVLIAVALAVISLASTWFAASLYAQSVTPAQTGWIAVGVSSPSSNNQAPAAFFLNITTKQVAICSTTSRCDVFGTLP